MQLKDLPVGALVKDANTKYNDETIVWRILGHDHDGDGTTSLESRDIITLKCFDTKEPNNSDSSRRNYGNNRYLHSNLLQWLNSDAAAGEWYTAQHSADAPPNSENAWQSSGTAINPYDTEAGFLANFSDELKSALQTVSKITVLNTVTDGGSYETVPSKIFLLSTTEVGLANENGIAEGTIYEYYNSNNTDTQRVRKPTEEAVSKSDYTDSSLNTEEGWYYWLRTPYAGRSYSVRYVVTNGGQSSHNAFSSIFGVAPAFSVLSTVTVSDTTDSDGAYTILWNSAPQIATETELGEKHGAFSTTYTVTDADADAVSAVVKLDGMTISETASVQLGTEQTITLSDSVMNKLDYGAHTITINAADATHTSTVVINFTFVLPELQILGSSGDVGEISAFSYSVDNRVTRKRMVPFDMTRADGTLTLSSDAVTLDFTDETATVTASGYTGSLTVVSGDTEVVSVSVSGNTITLSSVNETNGTVTVAVTASGDDNHAPITKNITVQAKFSQIYGAEWDGTSTTLWSRTDAAEGFTDPVPAVDNGTGSSPFDDIMPWAGMKKVENAVGTLVEIPKFYYKWTRDGAKMKLQISEREFDGSLVSPAHADRGDGKGERDVVYVARYHCGASTYKSTTGIKPQASVTRANFRTNIHNLGSTVWQWDFATYWTIAMLYLVEFADWNSQATIGYGCGNGSSTENAGATDAMQYHTGTNAANRTTYGHTQYRYIEDLWGNVYDWCDGIYFSGANVYCIKNPADFSDTTGGTLVGQRATSSNYISGYTEPSAEGFEYALYPNEVSGSDSTYVCDYCNYNASGVVLRVGGNYIHYQSHGLFYMYGYFAASFSYAYIGSRLMVLP